MNLFGLYFWTIIAGVIAAPALSLLGVQLATRDRAMQTLCVGQGAMVGVLAAIGLFHHLEGSVWGTLAPFLSAILLSGGTFLFTDSLVAKKVASKNTVFAFVFALLLSVGHLCSSLFPGLESHMAQVYFGDLATLTTTDSQITAIASLICLAILAVYYRTMSNYSFESAVFGSLISVRNARQSELAFRALSLIMLSFSVQFVGFLFTISMLFLPTAILNFSRIKGLARHLVLGVALSAVSAGTGFFISLKYTRLPTVPSIVIVLSVLCSVVLLGEACYRIFSRRGVVVKTDLSFEKPISENA